MASTPQFSIPPGLTNILEEFVVECIQEKPEDIVEFAAEYFKMKTMKKFLTKKGEGASSTAAKTAQKNECEEKDELGPSAHRQTRPNKRRTAVSAEAYNPDADKDWKPEEHAKTDKELKHLTEEVNKIVFLKKLEQEQLDVVLRSCFKKEVKSGEVIIKQGDDGDNFYVINVGQYDVYIEKEGADRIKVHTFNGSGMFGELALMYNCPRNATIISASEGSLWALDRRSFKRLVVGAAVETRQRYKELLGGVNILSELSEDEVDRVCDALEPQKYEDAEVVIKEGDTEADCMYFIESGAVKVTVMVDNEEKEVPFNKKYFGELALLTAQPRKATIYSVGASCKFLRLKKDAFDRLLGSCEEIMKRNAKEYEEQRKKLGMGK